MALERLPILVVNPADDDVFATRAAELAEAVASPLDLQAALRPDYPGVVVRPRDLSDESEVVWYVYRDGRWIARATS